MVKDSFWADQVSKIKNLLSEWHTLLSLLFRPAIFLSLVVAVVAVYLSNRNDAAKEVNLILSILASLASGIAGGFVVDWWKNTTGNTIAVKKGRSAVRNLTLVREKTKNLSERTRSMASVEEINNLLALLEKDLANSIKDWNDILPAVQEMEILNANLDEKERDNENLRRELEDLKTEYEKEKSWEDNEKEKLKELIEAKEAEASTLWQEIAKLKQETSRVTTSITSPSPAWASVFFSPEPSRLITTKEQMSQSTLWMRLCEKCQGIYHPSKIGDNGLCDKCNEIF